MVSKLTGVSTADLSLSPPFRLRLSPAFRFCHQVQSVVLPGEDELAFPLVQRLRTSPSSEQLTATKTAADRVSQSCSSEVTGMATGHPVLLYSLLTVSLFYPFKQRLVSCLSLLVLVTRTCCPRAHAHTRCVYLAQLATWLTVESTRSTLG